MARDMRKVFFARFICWLYKFRFCRKLCLVYLHKFEGGAFYSTTMRQLFLQYYGIDVGDYSYGECLKLGAWPPNVVVGRFVSVGPDVKVYLRNHPYERLSMHPFFYNHKLGYVSKDNIPSNRLNIEHDVWVGAHAVFLPGCSNVGIGAVVGSCAVVTKDVPAFAIVAGNPAKVIAYRFDNEQQTKILASCWWEKTVTSIIADYGIENMTIPFGEAVSWSILKDRK